MSSKICYTEVHMGLFSSGLTAFCINPRHTELRLSCRLRVLFTFIHVFMIRVLATSINLPKEKKEKKKKEKIKERRREKREKTFATSSY